MTQFSYSGYMVRIRPRMVSYKAGVPAVISAVVNPPLVTNLRLVLQAVNRSNTY